MRLVAGLAATGAALVGGCQVQPANMPKQEEPAVALHVQAKPRLALVSTLKGEWRVAGIDGQPFDQPVGLALSASKDEIWWAPRCAQFERGYDISGVQLIVAPAKWARARSSSERPPPCAIGLPTGLTEAFRAIDSATEVGRTPENGVLISGGGHSLLLFSQ
jgi:hypothetical protein